MLVGGVVYDQIHDDLHAPRVGLCKQAVKILHCAKFCHDRPIIRDIIAVVIVGGLIDRRQPQDIHPEFFKIRQMRGDPVQVPDSVTIAVRKAPGINLINDRFLPPSFLFHICAMTSFSTSAMTAVLIRRLSAALSMLTMRIYYDNLL